MTGIARYIGGVNSGWVDCGFTVSSFNSLANGSFVIASSVQCASEDLWAEVWFKGYMGGSSTSGAYLSIWNMPELPDSSYGDGTTNGTGLPAGTYYAAPIGVKAAVGSGSPIFGKSRPFPVDRGNFKWGVSVHPGAALNSVSSVTLQWRTTNLNLNS